MWHKPCRTFHPWCLCIKTRCLLVEVSSLFAGLSLIGTPTFPSGFRKLPAGSIDYYQRGCFTATRVTMNYHQCPRLGWKKISSHDDILPWKCFPHYWPMVKGIYWLPVDSQHKGPWRRALMFSLLLAWYKVMIAKITQCPKSPHSKPHCMVPI